jgi:CubicO group peptidase (beta-lactamase class C family)
MEEDPVASTDLYDIASVTKILGTLPLIMELEVTNVIDLDPKLGRLDPKFCQ